MKHEYDWSKLDAGWKVVMQGQALLRFGRRFAVAELEMCTECPPGSDDEYRELWSQTLDQLAKCRVIDNTPLFDAMDKMANEAESATQYDWSKLGSGWVFIEFNQCISRPTMGFSWRYWPDTGLFSAHITNPSMRPNSDEAKAAYLEAYDLAQKCRVKPAPEPSPEYNWTKLEGTGWREGNGAYLTNGKFNYWYTLGDRPRLEAFDKFHPDDAVTALNSAAAAVEQCRRDWRDEIMEACRGTGMSPVLGTRGTIFTIGNALNVDDQRRMRVLSTSMLDCTKLLALSLVIERLKKLGWRES